MAKAAEQGLDIAQLNIASYFLEKEGAVPYDPAQAIMWYRKAAEQGSSDAQCCLGEMFDVGADIPQDEEQAKSYYLMAALQDDETAQSWLWRKEQSEREDQSAPSTELAAPGTSAGHAFNLPPDSATALVRIAMNFLKQNPAAFLPELAELRILIDSHGSGSGFQACQGEQPSLPDNATPLASVANWFSKRDSLTLLDLRAYLLPLDLLPNAVIDELNERALDLTGEVALEEVGDEILVVQEILAAVLADWEEQA